MPHSTRFLINRRHRRRCSTVVRRRGFSLVELIIALLLLDIALLAVASSSALAARQLAAARAKSRMATAVQSRLEWAASIPCAPAQSGSAVVAGVGTEAWWLDGGARNVRLLRDSVQPTEPAHITGWVVESRIPC